MQNRRSQAPRFVWLLVSVIKRLLHLLLRYGTDVEAKPLRGETPLYVLKMLVAEGPDVDDSPAGCESALHGAMEREDREVVEVLAAGTTLGEKH